MEPPAIGSSADAVATADTGALPDTGLAGARSDSPFDTIGGILPPKLKSSGKPFLVQADIVVPLGVTVTVEPGAVFLFKNFTGLQVHGILLAKGTQHQPIVFTSENDRAFFAGSQMEAAPYDWNGITIHESGAGTTLEWCTVQYSLFGINALTEQVNIRAATFSGNGKSDLTVTGTQIAAQPQPFSYSYTPKVPDQGPLPALQGRPGAAEQRRAGRMFIRITSVSAAAVGLTLGVWKTLDFIESDRQFRDMDSFDAHDTDNHMSSKWEEARVKRNTDLAWMLGGYGLALAGTVGFTLSFVW